jgi:hypothetical protein
MAHVSITLEDINRLYKAIEVATVCPASPPVAPIHSPLYPPALPLALMAMRRPAEWRCVFDRFSTLALPWSSPVLVAFVTAEPRRTYFDLTAASLAGRALFALPLFSWLPPVPEQQGDSKRSGLPHLKGATSVSSF